MAGKKAPIAIKPSLAPERKQRGQEIVQRLVAQLPWRQLIARKFTA